ncbi:S8 family serine peptidase [Marinobacter santoriniensis]|uniref:S8 family serine peptidase n=1 Tax=Marinobacter santoriniensis TaxID=523742 RepID=UPI00135F143E|nr:S8 family serine peptidase [Marinobacter santoriniensis]
MVSGSIGIEANTRVDIDTADKLRLVDGYLDASSPQVLPGSVILGGYVSDRSGSRDPSDPNDDYDSDPIDRYQLVLNEGDQVELQTFYSYYLVSNNRVPANYPLSITLRRASDQVVLDSAQTNPDASSPVYSVQVTVPKGSGTATYYLDIEAIDGPMRYVINTLPSESATALAFDWPRYQFANDEALVSLADQGMPRTLTASLAASPVRLLGNNTWLMRRSDAKALSSSGGSRRTANWIHELRRQPGVKSATPNYKVFAQSPTSEPLYPKQWHYPLINAPAAWQLAPSGGSGVRVAVVDTGLFLGINGSWHPDLSDNVPPLGSTLLSGSDFVSQSDLDNDSANTSLYGPVGRDSIPADPGSAVGSNVFHGTHVAGTIAADANNNIGGTGLAFNASLLPVRVLGEGGSGSLDDLIAGLNWVASGNQAEIVNLSLGGLPFVQSLEDALESLNAKQITVVAAAGNSASSSREYPAASRYAVAVSAVDGAGNLTSYSNFGDWIDIAAPGGSAADANLDGQPDLVLSTSAALGDSGNFEPSYLGLAGTSMAAPHVSGIFALMKGVNGNLQPSNFEALLKSGALTRDGSGPRNDQFGYGILDSAKAVTAALDNPSVTVLSPDPYYVNLNDQKTSEIVTLTRIGDLSNDVSSCSVGSSPAWLSEACDRSTSPVNVSFVLTDPASLDPNVPLKTSVQITYTTDTQRTLEIPVSAQVVTDAEERDAGLHFVLLVRTEPDENGNYLTEAQDSVQADNGQYVFSFRHYDGVGEQEPDEVRPGTYYLVGGTDLDNDGIICQPGEACAEYPVSGLREAIHVDQNTDLTSIRMTTGFSRPTISAATPDVLPRPDFAGYRLIPEDDFVRPLKKLSGE